MDLSWHEQLYFLLTKNIKLNNKWVLVNALTNNNVLKHLYILNTKPFSWIPSDVFRSLCSFKCISEGGWICLSMMEGWNAIPRVLRREENCMRFSLPECVMDKLSPAFPVPQESAGKQTGHVKTKWTHWFISSVKWDRGSWEWHVSDNTHTHSAWRRWKHISCWCGQAPYLWWDQVVVGTEGELTSCYHTHLVTLSLDVRNRVCSRRHMGLDASALYFSFMCFIRLTFGL